MRILRLVFLGAPGAEAGPTVDGAQWPQRWQEVGFWVALGLVSILGVGLRVAYITQPYFQYDEGVTSAVASGLEYPRQWTTNWAAYPVPQGFRVDQFNFSSYHYLAHAWLVAGEVFVSPDHELSILRVLNLPLALATLIFTGSAVRRIAGWLPGVFAAALLAVLPILVQDSHYARCDTMLTAGVAALVWLLVPKGHLNNWHWASAGALVGWLVATKFSLVLIGPFLLGAAVADARANALGKTGLLRNCSWMALGGGLGFVLGVPGALTEPQAFLRGIEALLSHYNGYQPPNSLPDQGPVIGILVSYFTKSIGVGLLGFSCLGCVFLWRRMPRIWATGLVLSLALSVLVFGRCSFFAERNLSPFLPLMAVLAGCGVAWLIEMGAAFPKAPRGAGVVLAIVASILTLIVPFEFSLRLVGRGLSLKDHKEQDSFLAKVAAEAASRHLAYWNGWIPDQANLARAEAVARAGPAILAIYDLQDGNSKENIARLIRQYSGRVVARREGLFPEMPCCTLTTMVSARLIIIECKP